MAGVSRQPYAGVNNSSPQSGTLATCEQNRNVEKVEEYSPVNDDTFSVLHVTFMVLVLTFPLMVKESSLLPPTVVSFSKNIF